MLNRGESPFKRRREEGEGRVIIFFCVAQRFVLAGGVCSLPVFFADLCAAGAVFQFNWFSEPLYKKYWPKESAASF